MQRVARQRRKGTDAFRHDRSPVQEESAVTGGFVVIERHMLPDTGLHQTACRTNVMRRSSGISNVGVEAARAACATARNRDPKVCAFGSGIVPLNQRIGCYGIVRIYPGL